jgi:hypothetical protein
MRIRRATLLGGTVALALGAVASAGASRAPAASCVPRGAHVASARGALRVFTAVEHRYRELRACWGERGTALDLGAISGSDYFGDTDTNTVEAVSDACVAVQQHLTDHGGENGHFLNVYDVRTRRVWSDGSSLNAQTDPDSLSHGSTTIGPITDVVLGPGCSVAWISQSIYGGAAQVRKADRAGRVRLAQSVVVDLRSLCLHGTRLAWSQAGVAFSARLNGAPAGGRSVPAGD